MTGSTLLSIFVFEILQLEHTNSGDFHFWIPTSEFQGNWITAYWEWRQLPCHNDSPSSVFASSCDFGFSDNVLFLISVRLDPVGESGCLDICGNKLKHWIIMSIKVCVFLFLSFWISCWVCKHVAFPFIWFLFRDKNPSELQTKQSAGEHGEQQSLAHFSSFDYCVDICRNKLPQGGKRTRVWIKQTEHWRDDMFSQLKVLRCLRYEGSKLCCSKATIAAKVPLAETWASNQQNTKAVDF